MVATALLDRLLHHAVIIQIEGSSRRLRQHADLVPERVRSKAPINATQPPQDKRRGRPTKDRHISINRLITATRPEKYSSGTSEEISSGVDNFYTPKAGEKVSRAQKTQAERALSALGIEHIAASSPEAHGPSERVFNTFQDRLPKEPRLAGITTVEAANAWFKDHYIAEHNGMFAIEPEDTHSAFMPDRHEAWRETHGCSRSARPATTTRPRERDAACSCRSVARDHISSRRR